MSYISSMLNITNTQVRLSAVGYQLVYDALVEAANRFNLETEAARAALVGGQVETGKLVYKPGAYGEMQELPTGGEPDGRVNKASWEVAVPLREFGDVLALDRVSLAYMTIEELDNQFTSMAGRYLGTLRKQMLQALFKNTDTTFQDETYGALTLKPLANGDTVTYPHYAGTNATRDHYLVAGYVASGISAANDPVSTCVNELEEVFGYRTGGESVAFFAPRTVTDKLKAITGFILAEDAYVRSGVATDVPTLLPNVPGRIVGRYQGAWVIEWKALPTVPNEYAICVNLEQPGPLLERVDPASTGLPRGFHLRSTFDDFVNRKSWFAYRGGVAVGNRLNGIAMQFKASGSYDIPTVYA